MTRRPAWFALLGLLSAAASAQDFFTDVYRPRDLAKLIQAYRSYGLPIPPPDAKTIILATGIYSRGELGPEGDAIAIGLLDARRADRSKWVVYRGTDVVAESNLASFSMRKDLWKYLVVPEGDLRLQFVENLDYSVPAWDENTILATCIQLAATGRTRLAEELLPKAFPTFGHGSLLLYQSGDATEERAVAILAFGYACREWSKPDADRRRLLAIAKRTHAVLKPADPIDPEDARQREERYDDYVGYSVKGMEESLRPSAARPGTPERAIDDLVHADGTDPWGYQRAPSAPIATLERFGFAAVPAMLDHVDDRRVTRVVMSAFMNSSTHLMTVGEIVTGLLGGLADNIPPGYWGREAEFRSWWSTAKDKNEEAYLLSRLIPKPRLNDENDPSRGYGRSGPSGQILRMLAARYPAALSSVYIKTAKERPDIVTGGIFDRLVASSAPREEVIRFSLDRIRSKDENVRFDGFKDLARLDKAAYRKAFLPEVEGLELASTSISWGESIGTLAIVGDEAWLWRRLAEVAPRARPQIRAALCFAMIWGPEDESDPARLRFLSGFLDDVSGLSESQLLEVDKEFNHTFGSGPVSLKTVAAYCIGRRLDWYCEGNYPGAFPDEKWSPARWQSFRVRCRAELDRRGLLVNRQRSKP